MLASEAFDRPGGRRRQGRRRRRRRRSRAGPGSQAAASRGSSPNGRGALGSRADARPIAAAGPAVDALDELVVAALPGGAGERHELDEAEREEAEREQEREDAADEAVAARARRLDRVAAGDPEHALDEPGAGQPVAADQDQRDRPGASGARGGAAGVALEQVGEEGERPDDDGEDQVGVEVGDDPGGVVEAEVDRDQRVDHRADAADRPAGEADVEQRRGERPVVAGAPDEHRHRVDRDHRDRDQRRRRRRSRR